MSFGTENSQPIFFINNYSNHLIWDLVILKASHPSPRVYSVGIEHKSFPTN